MGHASSSYWLQTSEYNGTYRNKFKRGGAGIKWTPWKTDSGNGRMFLNDAKKMWLEAYEKRDPAKLTRFRVRYKNKTVIDDAGSVYEIEKGTQGEYLRFVENLRGL